MQCFARGLSWSIERPDIAYVCFLKGALLGQVIKQISIDFIKKHILRRMEKRWVIWRPCHILASIISRFWPFSTSVLVKLQFYSHVVSAVAVSAEQNITSCSRFRHPTRVRCLLPCTVSKCSGCPGKRKSEIQHAFLTNDDRCEVDLHIPVVRNTHQSDWSCIVPSKEHQWEFMAYEWDTRRICTEWPQNIASNSNERHLLQMAEW